MHDLNFFRDHLELFEQMARHRGITLDLQGFRALDRERRELITAAERLKAERNKASEEIARRKKSGQDAAGLIAEMKRVSGEIKQYDEHIAQLDERTPPGLATGSPARRSQPIALRLPVRDTCRNLQRTCSISRAPTCG